MQGRQSSDQKCCFGFLSEFVRIVFPWDNEVVSHALYLRRKNTSLGIWKQNTPDNVVSKVVADNISSIWDKTEIPQIDPKSVENKVERILARAKLVLKLDQSRRNESELAKIWGGLFDISRCPNRELKLCDFPNCDTSHLVVLVLLRAGYQMTGKIFFGTSAALGSNALLDRIGPVNRHRQNITQQYF